MIVSCSAARKKSRRPTKARENVDIPPVSCPDLYDATIDIGHDGYMIRKTQHKSDCKKYFECVLNRWLARDCPDGTTFSQVDKACDSTKSCKPQQVTELYEEGIEELKRYLGISERPEI